MLEPQDDLAMGGLDGWGKRFNVVNPRNKRTHVDSCGLIWVIVFTVNYPFYPCFFQPGLMHTGFTKSGELINAKYIHANLHTDIYIYIIHIYIYIYYKYKYIYIYYTHLYIYIYYMYIYYKYIYILYYIHIYILYTYIYINIYIYIYGPAFQPPRPWSWVSHSTVPLPGGV